MTKRPNEKNERLKRRFVDYRKFARQLSGKSLDRELAALERFDVWNGRKDFGKFHIEWAMGFRTHLETAKGTTGKLSANPRHVRFWQLSANSRSGFLSRMALSAGSGRRMRITSTSHAATRLKPAPRLCAQRRV